MQKSVKRAFLLVPLLVLAVVVAAMSLNQRGIESSLAVLLLEQTGLVLQTGSHASFALLPRPQIRIENVQVADSTGAVQIVTGAVALKGNLRLLALLVGRVQFEQIVLVKPTITLDLDRLAGGQPLRALPANALADPPKPERSDRLPGLIVVHNGTLALKSARAGIDTVIEDANLKLDWPGMGGPMAINGRIRWQDQSLVLAVWLGDVTQWLGGGLSPATVMLRNGEGRLALRGMLGGGLDGRFSGQVQASVPALSHVLRLAGIEAALPQGVENAEISAALSGTGRELDFTGLRLNVLGAQFDGALTLRTDAAGRSLSGTLATEMLPLSGWIDRLHWNRAPGDENLLWQRLAGAARGWALDLRLSAGSITGTSWHMEDAAMAVRGRAGQLDLDLAQARLFGGQVQARAGLTRKGSGLAVTLEVQALQASLEAVCQAVHCQHGLSGQADLTVNLGGEGLSAAKIAETLTGKAKMRVANAAIQGFDLALALRRVEKHLLPSIPGFREGVSAYDWGELAVNFDGINATIEKCTLTGQATQVELGGTASLATGQLALRGLATQTAPDGGMREDGPQLRFKVGGLWKAPAFVIVADGLQPGFGQ